MGLTPCHRYEARPRRRPEDPPEAFTTDAERLTRFGREAKVLASLNHPNIAAIYGLEDSRETHALVLELVEGPTLADRIAQGPIPLDEALPIARQIAEALEAAHEAGVIHRDLKPANIKVRDDGTVKVLDFGLAKAIEPEVSEADQANSPTLTAAATRAGIIMGTAAYMAPEQARGKSVDKRADIWAFGAVLYEMLTGKPAFEGETVSDIIAEILGKDPDWEGLPRQTPGGVRRLLARCLRKDPRVRVHDIADARIEIDDGERQEIEEQRLAQGGTGTGFRPILSLVGAGAALVGGMAVYSVITSTPVEAPSPTRLTIPLPPGRRLALDRYVPLTLSRDGTRLVYGARESGRQQLYLRSLNRFGAEPIAGTEGATDAFFSPDGEWLGFVAGGMLRKVPLAGGSPVPIGDILMSRESAGAAWLSDQSIIFANGPLGLFRVSSDGGEPERLTTPDATRGEVAHSFPDILPDGDGVLFTIETADAPTLAVLSLETGDWRTLAHEGLAARYLPTGHLLYGLDGQLFAMPFDVARRELSGTPASVLDDLLLPSGTGAPFVVSRAGTLAYVPASAGRGSQNALVWVDRDGHDTRLVQSEDLYVSPRLSPDNERIAVDIGKDIGIIDTRRGTSTRLTIEGRENRIPVWTPDGTRIAFASDRADTPNLDIYWTGWDGNDVAEPLLESERFLLPWSWSPDGQRLAFYELHPDTGRDIWVLPLEGGRHRSSRPRSPKRPPCSPRTVAGSRMSRMNRVSLRSTCSGIRMAGASSGSRPPEGASQSGRTMDRSCSIARGPP